MSSSGSAGLLDEVVAALLCPVCGGGLSADVSSLICAAGHRFDAARQGYVNLAAGLPRRPLGDDAAAVAARVEFLTAGHFAPLVAELVAQAVTAWPGGLVLDAGSGPGHYLAAVLDELPDAVGLAVDSSQAALRRAARAHRRAGAIGWDLWKPLPLRDCSAGLVLNVFAPRNGSEYARVLRPDGALLVVVPGPDHLTELVTELDLITVDPDKEGRLTDSLGGYFVQVAEYPLRRTVSLTQQEISGVIRMGPNAGPRDSEALVGLVGHRLVTIEFSVRIYRPR